MAETIIVPNIAERQQVEWILNRSGVSVKLYKAISPALGAATVVANFTESTETGYAAASLTAGNWAYATDGDGHTQALYNTGTPLDFEFTEAAEPLGFYVVWNDGTDDHIMWCAALTSVPAGGYPSGGGTVQLILAYSLNQLAAVV